MHIDEKAVNTTPDMRNLHFHPSFPEFDEKFTVSGNIVRYNKVALDKW